MTCHTDEDNGTENFRCFHISFFPSVEIFRISHFLLNDIVDFPVEECEKEHGEEVEQDHSLDHVTHDVFS